MQNFRKIVGAVFEIVINPTFFIKGKKYKAPKGKFFILGRGTNHALEKF